MADFYSLLRQSLLDRGVSDPGERQEIYAQARQAVIKQLWDFKPPLAEDEIDTRVGAYDSAVERIESDLREIFAQTRVKARKRRPRAPLPVPPPPMEEEVEAPSLAALDLDEGPRRARGVFAIRPAELSSAGAARIRPGTALCGTHRPRPASYSGRRTAATRGGRRPLRRTLARAASGRAGEQRSADLASLARQRRDAPHPHPGDRGLVPFRDSRWSRSPISSARRATAR